MTPRGIEIANSLTTRESETLVELCSGATAAVIASNMGLKSAQCVKNNLRSLYDKAGVNSRYEMMLLAWRHGIVACPCGANRE